MKKIISTLICLSFLFLIGCTKEEMESEKSKTKKNRITEKEVEEVEATHIYPLTGMESSEKAEDRTIGVMVNNHPAARPQSGLSKADIIFEILAEGEITRFLALFQSEKPEMIGPVRSAREYYFELAKGYDALYVYHGAAKFVNDMIIDRGIEHLNGSIYDNDQHLFKRESFRKAPHNSYLLFDAVYDVAESKGYDIIRSTEALPFVKDEKQIDGDPARHIEIAYPGRSDQDTIQYVYQDGKYTRFDRQEQTVELESEEAIEIDNLFIIETAHEVIDDAGRRSVDLESGGKAYLLQRGKVQVLEWENQAGKIVPVKEGKQVGFVEGNTWVNVVPSTPGIEQIITVSE